MLNLSSRISWQDLKDLLRRAGEVCFAEAHTEARNEGRVELASSEDLERVVKRYQGYDLNGRKIELVREKYKSRSRSRSRSRRRTRSPSRSRSRRRSRSRSKSRSRSHSSNKSRSKSVQSKVDPEDQDVKRQRRHSRDSKDSRPKSRNSNKESSAELHKSESQTREEDLAL